MRAYLDHFEELLATGIGWWHERSDLRGKKSRIDTLHGDILAVLRRVFFLLEEVGADWCRGTFGRRWCLLGAEIGWQLGGALGSVFC